MFDDLIESFSGIRGVYGQSITEELLQKYIIAYFTVFPEKKRKILIAGDTRPSTCFLKEAGIKILKSIGIEEIVDAGVIPIEAAELAVVKFSCFGGIYITASHNEPEYNGWKFLKEDGAILYAEQAEKIINAVHRFRKEPFRKEPGSFSLEKELEKEPGSFRHYRVLIKNTEKQAQSLYCDYVLEKLGKEAVEKIKQAKPKVLFDPNGGSSINILKILAEKLNLQAKFVNDQSGIFNRLVEPKAESLAYLESYWDKETFEFAAGFDCDADRVEIIIDPVSDFAKTRGSLVNGNYVLALACDGVLAGTKNQVVVTNDVSSYLIRDIIKKYQAVIKEVEVGETNIVAEMEKQKSLIGGEGSNGGMIIPPIKCRDGIMATCLFLKIIAQTGKSLSDILQEYPKYYSSHNKAQCSGEKSLEIKNKLEDYYRNKSYIIKKTGDETGGLKADVDDNSFIWFRQSKTEPGAFRIYSETDTSQQKANTLAREAVKIFERFDNKY